VNFNRLLANLILIIFVLIISACKPQPADCSREDVFCVGLVTAYDSVEDNGLNQAAWKTLQTIGTQAHIKRLDNIESVDLRDWEKNIVFFADNGYDVIVTVGSNLSATTIAVAAKYPGISFIGIDQELDEVHENIATITFAEDEAGFLAGILAAMVTTSGKVGAICETSGIDEVWQYCEGFRAGAVYEKEEIDVIVTYHENGNRDKTFNDPEWGQKKMLSQIDNGVDTMTAFGGNTAQGAFLAASENSVLVIGSEEDLYYRLPDLQAVLVTSIINDPDVELSSLVLRASQGETIFGTYAGRISYAPFRMPRFEAETEIKSNMEDALQKIRNGEIEINIPEKK
jgi:basic membrane protein A